MMKERFVHYRTGIDEIDNEHFSLLVQMEEAVALCNQKSNDELKAVLLKMQADLESHLLHEEQYMREHNYKYLEPHIHLHDEIRLKMRTICKIERFEFHHFRYIVQELESIIMKHIDSYDMQISMQ